MIQSRFMIDSPIYLARLKFAHQNVNFGIRDHLMFDVCFECDKRARKQLLRIFEIRTCAEYAAP